MSWIAKQVSESTDFEDIKLPDCPGNQQTIWLPDSKFIYLVVGLTASFTCDATVLDRQPFYYVQPKLNVDVPYFARVAVADSFQANEFGHIYANTNHPCNKLDVVQSTLVGLHVFGGLPDLPVTGTGRVVVGLQNGLATDLIDRVVLYVLKWKRK